MKVEQKMKKCASSFWTILLMSLIVLVITWPAPAQKLHSFYPAGVPSGMNPSFPLLSRTEVVKLRYTKAKNVIHTLADSFLTYIKVDKDNNALVITAPNNIFTRIKSDLLLIDRPAR